MLPAAVVMGLALAGRSTYCSPSRCTGLQQFAALALLVAVGLAVYGAAALAFGAGDWGELRRMAARRRGRRLAAGTATDPAPRP